MPIIYQGRNCIQQGSNTSTTGGTIFLTVAAPAGRLNFRDLYANGATVALELLDSATGIFEFSYGTLVYGISGPTSDSITSRVITNSSSGVAVPIAWGGGAKNAYAMVSIEQILLGTNNLSDIQSPVTARANLLLGSSSVYPAGAFGLVDTGWSGGTIGNFVRFSSANTLTDAANTHTPLQLSQIFYKATEGYYSRGLIGGFSGLTANAPYYLGSTPGSKTSTQPTVTPGGSTALVLLGTAASTTTFFMSPRLIAHG